MMKRHEIRRKARDFHRHFQDYERLGFPPDVRGASLSKIGVCPMPFSDSSPQARYRQVSDALVGLPGVTVASKKGFGEGGLMVAGKLFATLRGEEMLLKLPAARVAALIADGSGSAFDAGKGKAMKEWVTVQATGADWLALAREAMAFVGR